jgi:hypothetical protein
MEEPAARGSVDARNAVVALFGLFVSAKFVFAFVEFDEAADEEIEFAVIVVIKPDGAGSPAGSREASFFGDVGEGAIAIVAIENAAAVLRDVHVRQAVAVVVADGNAHAVAAGRDAGFFGDVGEGAVAIVFIKSVA